MTPDSRFDGDSDAGRVPVDKSIDDDGATEDRTLAYRLRFLQLEPSDAETLRSLLGRFHEFERQFVDEFYNHLRSFPLTAQFLNDPARFERLQQMQRQHLRTLLEARWDDEYAAARRRVGDAHAEVGIEPQFFIGAYFQYVQHCIRHYFAHDPVAHDQPACEAVLSLLKAVFLDIGLTLDAYFAQSTQKLQSALDLLWRANQDLRQFAQLTSHDLKTPLATVANLCEETLDEFGEAIPAEARRLIASARQRVFRMSDMIDELLSSTVASESTEQRAAIDPARSAAEAVDRLRPAIAAKGLKVTVPQNWPKVWGNHVRLREALYNLVSNAVKYVDADTGKIRLIATSDAGSVRICVVDNGPGIPAEELNRVFAPFHRLQSHRDQPGTGLGLYFAKNLIEAMGGRISVESQLGLGSTFCVELRAA